MPNSNLGYRIPTQHDAGGASEVVLTQIQEALQGLRFGSVTIIVQDGMIVQVDRTEKRRLSANVVRPTHSSGDSGGQRE